MKVATGLKKKNPNLNMEISDEILSDIQTLIKKINNGKCCIESIKIYITYDDGSVATDKIISNLSSGHQISEMSINNIESILDRFVENSEIMNFEFFMSFKESLLTLYGYCDSTETDVGRCLISVNSVLNDLGLRYRIRQRTCDEVLRHLSMIERRNALLREQAIDFVVYMEE